MPQLVRELQFFKTHNVLLYVQFHQSDGSFNTQVCALFNPTGQGPANFSHCWERLISSVFLLVPASEKQVIGSGCIVSFFKFFSFPRISPYLVLVHFPHESHSYLPPKKWPCEIIMYKIISQVLRAWAKTILLNLMFRILYSPSQPTLLDSFSAILSHLYPVAAL